MQNQQNMYFSYLFKNLLNANKTIMNSRKKVLKVRILLGIDSSVFIFNDVKILTKKMFKMGI